MIPPQGAPAFVVNWFDQLGVKRGLQQFHLDGKKSYKAAPAHDYFIDKTGVLVRCPAIFAALVASGTA
ncbi:MULTISPECIES: hypothetical protein [unclassified Mesorhizobium]|uniref:hypothetical protein n=1 Tax=unclassified Mesorhizobium TaxID=325217 RepID=UPI000FCB0BE3|nr:MULTISPECIES: hypothetical protein [unclassified Mesorhizobium]RUV89392.1 hypothetical protein EOA88_13360 [Mesorhizobium sp. M5C.F.Ca.IN.020.14.1.1]QIA21745.1 hypothetical protein A9K68_007900 [Mesorhizobium sp. AA22]RUV29339.1 hypothetical protein EOA86_15955 [Mesorhizobium sp. M5C.F.Ca.IN.020.32.2.1]RUV62265.1 hypothetical protein EOA85_06010 [Mesorhizobium sp. M5C.F.Ca.IN.020.29.1.1]RWC39849.1 MAG: hypothetical protein EOS28_25370 [Mesorhizobium sp.]